MPHSFRPKVNITTTQFKTQKYVKFFPIFYNFFLKISTFSQVFSTFSKFFPSPQDIEGMEKHSVTFSCGAEGFPAPEYSWVNQESEPIIGEDGQININQATGELTILNLRPDQAGEVLFFRKKIFKYFITFFFFFQYSCEYFYFCYLKLSIIIFNLRPNEFGKIFILLF